MELVVMAAGMGSRFGGLKQIAPLGPNGEFIIDYSVYDAIRGGFGKVVFVVRKTFRREFEEKIAIKYNNHIEVAFVEQELDKRQKAGKAVAVAGIAAAIVVSTAGCLPSTTMGDMAPPQSTSATNKVPASTGNDIPVLGDIDYAQPTEGELMGEPLPAPTGDEVPPTLMGVPADPDLWD